MPLCVSCSDHYVTVTLCGGMNVVCNGMHAELSDGSLAVTTDCICRCPWCWDVLSVPYNIVIPS